MAGATVPDAIGSSWRLLANGCDDPGTVEPMHLKPYSINLVFDLLRQTPSPVYPSAFGESDRNVEHVVQSDGVGVVLDLLAESIR